MIRVIAHLDLDCFYCQVEHKRLAIPNHVPLAVQQWNNVIAVNYAARASPFSIKRGMSADECKKRCPNIQLIHVELVKIDSNGSPSTKSNQATSKVSLERYRRASEEIMAIFQRYIPLCERASIDEAYLDLTSLAEVAETNNPTTLENVDPDIITTVDKSSLSAGSSFDRRLISAAVMIALIRQKVFEELGYTVSAGLAANKLLAKQASAARKPNKQTLVPISSVNSLMAELDVSDVRGLGGKLGEAVQNFSGVKKAVELQAYPESVLCKQFGHKTGLWLYRICRGLDDEPVKQNLLPMSILAFKSFSPVHTKEDLAPWIRLLCEDLCGRMESDRKLNRRRPKTLSIQYRGDGVTTATGVTPSAVGGYRGNSATISKNGPMPGFGSNRTPSVEELGARVMNVVLRLPKPFPCSRIGIGAVDMVEAPPAKSQSAVSAFFKPRDPAVPTRNSITGVSHCSPEHAGGLKLSALRYWEECGIDLNCDDDCEDEVGSASEIAAGETARSPCSDNGGAAIGMNDRVEENMDKEDNEAGLNGGRALGHAAMSAEDTKKKVSLEYVHTLRSQTLCTPASSSSSTSTSSSTSSSQIHTTAYRSPICGSMRRYFQSEDVPTSASLPPLSFSAVSPSTSPPPPPSPPPPSSSPPSCPISLCPDCSQQLPDHWGETERQEHFDFHMAQRLSQQLSGAEHSSSTLQLHHKESTTATGVRMSFQNNASLSPLTKSSTNAFSCVAAKVVGKNKRRVGGAAGTKDDRHCKKISSFFASIS